MKKAIVLIISVFSLVILGCQQPMDPDKENEAIITLIEEETQSYYDKDFDRWGSVYTQTDENIWMMASQAWHEYRDGWKTQADAMKSAFDTEKEINREVKKPIEVKIYDKSAYIVFENELFDENEESLEKVR